MVLELHLVDLVVDYLHLVLLSLTEKHVDVLALTEEVRVVYAEVAKQFLLARLYSYFRVAIDQKVPIVDHSQHWFRIFSIFFGIVSGCVQSKGSIVC